MPLPKLFKDFSDVKRPTYLDPAIKKIAVAEDVVVIFPSASVEEQLFWDFLERRGGHWIQQRTFGDIRIRGSTRVDFFSEQLKAAIFLDGWYFHSKTVGLDALKRSRVEQRGYRVYTFTFYSRADFDKRYKGWYFSNFTA